MLPSIFVPNVVITRNYETMKKFMSGRKLTDIRSEDFLDSFIFLSEQNKYIYSFEHSQNFGQSDLLITLKILDTDGNFESSVLGDTYLNKAISTKLERFFSNNINIKDFNTYMNSVLHGNIRIYVTYGVGDDLTNWADPKCCTLVDAEIDVASNGIRNYVYKFQPLPNAFFSLIPSKDDKDPNSNDAFDIPFASMEVTEDIFIEDVNKVSVNIKDVMKGFAAKATSTPRENVIVLIPDIDNKFNNFIQKYFKNPNEAYRKMGTYESIFRSIKFYSKPRYEAPDVRARSGSADAEAEMEAEYRKDLKQFKDDANKYDLVKYTFALKEKQEIESKLVVFKELNPYSISDEQSREIALLSERLQELTKIIETSKDPQINEENSSKPYEHKLIMTAAIDINNKDLKNIYLDTRKAILDVFAGINVFFEGNMRPVMAYETNLKWLKIFKKFGLIENEEIPCLIIGDRGLVYYYLYGGRFLHDLDDLQYSFSTYDFYKFILESDSYKQYVMKVIGRKKTNSSFSENLFIDELSFNNDETKKALSEIELKSSLTGRPIFISNFRNSNVLSFSLKNSENYGTVLNQSVRDQRLNYLYQTLDDSKKKELLKRAGLSPNAEDTLKLSRKIYEEATKLLKGDKLPEDFMLRSEEISVLENMGTDKKSKNMFDRSSELSKVLSILEINPATDSGLFSPTDIKKSSELIKGLVINQSSKEDISYLDLKIRFLLVKNNTVDNSNLAILSKLIIILNRAQKEDLGVVFTSNKFLPGEASILARAYEYAKKLSVELSIKTLPFFHLSDFETLTKKCLFLSKRNNIIGTKPNDTYDFFSGEYMIVGFRHVITTSEAYSEFLLNKFGTSDDKFISNVRYSRNAGETKINNYIDTKDEEIRNYYKAKRASELERQGRR